MSLTAVTDNYLTLTGQEITASTVPVSLGGTGATTTAGARNSLGFISGTFTWSVSPNRFQTVSIPGVTSNSTVTVTMNGVGNSQFLSYVEPGANQIIVHMNGDPGNDTKFSYIIIN